MASREDKKKNLDRAISQVEKQFGEGSVMRLGSAGSHLDVSAIPTGALTLDIALGVGGLPRGRVVELYGPEGSGKTTLAMHCLAEAQRAGGNAALIDAEHAFSPEYAKDLGLNLDELLISQPDSGEEALEIVDTLISSGALDVIAVDSVAALVPRAELEGAVGDTHVGLQARLMSQAMRKLSGHAADAGTILIFINQIREKIGVMFGNPETTPGGRALKFWASVRLEVRRRENLKDGTDIVGSRTSVRVVKNKVAPPFKNAEFDIIFGRGISRLGCVLDEGVEQEIVEKAGSWYSYGEERLGQGRENAVEYLEANPDLALEIENRIRERVGLPLLERPVEAAQEETPAEDAQE
ncbi:MAG: recombinase RecA [candidate division WS1 bacterium]|jgi:recombination protein RecA|nr:recombinase RecA [candidate division WS1 bacterium]